jgi:hypothetical protein
MDIRIASTDARFGFVFARRGIVPEACSSWFLPRIVGVSKALEWNLSGRVFSAKEALASGLVSAVHTPAELIPAARTLVREIADNTAPVSVALTRQMMWRMLGADHPMEAHKIESRAIFARGASADVREGVTSFLEKRAPRFTDEVSNVTCPPSSPGGSSAATSKPRPRRTTAEFHQFSRNSIICSRSPRARLDALPGQVLVTLFRTPQPRRNCLFQGAKGVSFQRA